MAGSLPGGALNALGTALIPETMARLQMPALIDQAKREQQVGNIHAGRLLGGADAEIGTPQTKAFKYTDGAGNERVLGQNNPSTIQPLFSPAKKMALFSQAFPEQARAAQAQQIQNTLFPQGFTGTLGEGQVAYQNGKQVAAGPAKTLEGANKEGDTKDFIIGNQLVPHMYTGGKWQKMEGMGGPRWEAQKPPQKPYGYDDEQARKAEEAARKARADEYAFQSTDEGFSDIMRKAAQLGTNPNLASYTGTYDALTPNVFGGAKQFQADLDVLKSNLAMNALNAAKAASASGATGFGALSEGELKILQNQIATLDPSVGPENFQRQIVDIINKTKKMQGALRSTRPATAAAPSTASAIPGFKIEPLD